MFNLGAFEILKGLVENEATDYQTPINAALKNNLPKVNLIQFFDSFIQLRNRVAHPHKEVKGKMVTWPFSEIYFDAINPYLEQALTRAINELSHIWEFKQFIVESNQAGLLTLKSEDSGEIEELSKVVFANQYDLCLIKAKKRKIRKFANTTPNNGDNVHSFAYPGGAFGKDVYPLYKGTWNGKIENKCLTTIPVVGGSSGSSVLNNKDEIVSVIVSTMQNFNHFTLSVCLDDIKDFIQKADAILQQEE